MAPAIGRLAPSPTGHLHLGHARSFLLAYWSARSQGGRLILRLEDLDVDRAAPAYIDDAIEDLSWLGVDWDDAPVVQSRQLPAIEQAAHQLLEAGLAYPCTCTRGDLRRAVSAEPRGAPQAGTRELRYPGTCRGRFETLEQAERETGRRAGLRLLTRDVETEFEDGVFGAQSFNVFREVGDFLIQRRDRSPAYQLAVTVSDILGGVTEVLRGEDLLPSTARQLLLYRSLGRTPPRFAHLPLVCDAAGERLAKRRLALSLRTLRERGVDPRRLVTWAAVSAGLLSGETARLHSAAELVGAFELARLPLGSVLLADDAFL